MKRDQEPTAYDEPVVEQLSLKTDRVGSPIPMEHSPYVVYLGDELVISLTPSGGSGDYSYTWSTAGFFLDFKIDQNPDVVRGRADRPGSYLGFLHVFDKNKFTVVVEIRMLVVPKPPKIDRWLSLDDPLEVRFFEPVVGQKRKQPMWVKAKITSIYPLDDDEHYGVDGFNEAWPDGEQFITLDEDTQYEGEID